MNRAKLSIWMLVLWVLANALPIGLFYLAKHNLHSEFAENSAIRKNVQVFSITTEQYNNAKEGVDEISLAGELYDVLEVQKLSDKVRIKVVPDDKESTMEQGFHRLTKSNGKKSQNVVAFDDLIKNIVSTYKEIPAGNGIDLPYPKYGNIVAKIGFFELKDPPPEC